MRRAKASAGDGVLQASRRAAFTGSYAEFEHVLQARDGPPVPVRRLQRGHPGAGVQTLVAVNPPLWFMEGMAEYCRLARSSRDAMWLRDRGTRGPSPSIEEMTADPYIFPYRYGHALWAYIGEKWGDEVIGEILQSSATSGSTPLSARAGPLARGSLERLA